MAGPRHTRLLPLPAVHTGACSFALSGSGKLFASESVALNSGQLRWQVAPCVTWRTLSAHPALPRFRLGELVTLNTSRTHHVVQRLVCPQLHAPVTTFGESPSPCKRRYPLADYYDSSAPHSVLVICRPTPQGTESGSGVARRAISPLTEVSFRTLDVAYHAGDSSIRLPRPDQSRRGQTSSTVTRPGVTGISNPARLTTS